MRRNPVTLATIREIDRFTEINAHTEALVVLARALDFKRAAKVLKHIAGIHDILGYLPEGVNEYRSQIRKELLELARQEIDADLYQKLRRSF
jgi:hypothetical protein